MNSCFSFNQFVRDIGDLYCKTKLASIENLYIKLAQSFDYSNFGSWLKNIISSNSKVSQDFKGSLSDPNTLDYILELNNINNNWSNFSQKGTDGVLQNLVTQYQLGEKAAKIPRLFNGIITSALVPKLYTLYPNPLKAINELINSGQLTLSADSDKVAENLKNDAELILSEYGKSKKQMKEESEKIFYFLLDRFSKDISSALQSIGRNDLAQSILSQKILWRPDLLSGILPMSESNLIQGGMLGELARNISYKTLYDNGNLNSIYEQVKQSIFHFAGMIDKRNIDALRHEEMADQDLKSMQEGGKFNERQRDVKNQGTDNIDISATKWLNPEILTMISYFLYALYLQVSRN